MSYNLLIRLKILYLTEKLSKMHQIFGDLS